MHELFFNVNPALQIKINQILSDTYNRLQKFNDGIGEYYYIGQSSIM